MSNSTVFTIGSALRQAENDGFPVGLMVDGQWFAGAIGGLDGDGVLLDAEDGQVTIRLTAISVVRTIRDAAVASRLSSPATTPATIAPVLSLTRSEEPPAEEPTTEGPTAEGASSEEPTEKLPSVAEQLAAQVDEDLAQDDEDIEDAVELEDAVEDAVEDADEDEPVDEAMTQLALIEEEMALLEHLPEDVTDDERYALAKRRALMAQKAAAAFADPAAIVAGLTGAVIEAPEPLIDVSPIEVGRIELPAVAESPVEETPADDMPAPEETPADDMPADDMPATDMPATDEAPAAEPRPLADLSPAEPLRLDMPAEPTDDELELHPVEQIALVEAAVAAEQAANPLVHSSTQTDDWRAMLVSLRQQAAETPQTTEPEKRRSWRLAR